MILLSGYPIGGTEVAAVLISAALAYLTRPGCLRRQLRPAATSSAGGGSSRPTCGIAPIWISVGPANLHIGDDGRTEFAFGAVHATAELRWAPKTVFSRWTGFDEGDEITGDGSAELQLDSTIEIARDFFNSPLGLVHIAIDCPRCPLNEKAVLCRLRDRRERPDTCIRWLHRSLCAPARPCSN
jgi:hypothetical protein